MKAYKFAPDRFEHEGWRGQFVRMERWHDRVLSAIRAGEPDAEDFVYAFCQNAYHLRDWLRKSGAATQSELDGLMSQTPALKLCRDVCNGSKHFSLDLHRTQTDHVGLMREYVPSDRSGAEARDRPALLVFEGQDGSVNMREIAKLMDECVSAWRSFCQGR